MTVDALKHLTAPGLLSDEDALAPMMRWHAAGQRAALVTLVGIEGGAPRHPGAQMAVAEDGRYAGYLSGGCLEESVALEAKAALAEGKNRLVRYGKGSPYVDIRLPCGSGLDIYVDQSVSAEDVARMATLRRERRPFVRATDLTAHTSTVREWAAEGRLPQSGRKDNVFERVYTPPLQLLLLGNGPALVAIAALAETLGIELKIVTQDATTRAGLSVAGRHALTDESALAEDIARFDSATAAILVFHEHEREIDHLAALLESPCFYIGALGNHAVHRERLKTLSERGVTPENLARIHAPVGFIPGAKSKATLAIGVLAELMTIAKSNNLAA